MMAEVSSMTDLLLHYPFSKGGEYYCSLERDKMTVHTCATDRMSLPIPGIRSHISDVWNKHLECL